MTTMSLKWDMLKPIYLKAKMMAKTRAESGPIITPIGWISPPSILNPKLLRSNGIGVQMRNYQVLLISERPLFIEAITRVLKAEDISVTAIANNIIDAQLVLTAHAVNVIVIDYDDAHLNDSEIASQLIEDKQACLVIFLKMAGNQMIVYRREQVEDVTSSDLLDAIRGMALPSINNEA